MHLLVLIFFVFLAGCAEDVQRPLEKTKELIILTRPGATTYAVDEQGASGFDYELARLLARDLGLESRVVVAENDADVLSRLKNGEAHIAAAWQTPVDEASVRSSRPYFESHHVLVTHEASLPLTKIQQLAGKTVHVIAGSRQETALREVQQKVPSLVIAALAKGSELDLMEGVASQRFDAVLVNNAEFDIGSNYYPELQDSLQVGPARPIVWLFGPSVDPDLVGRADDFLERLQASGEMARFKDRYFGHVDRLTQNDSVHFIDRLRTVLPQYRAVFQSAQRSTGIDWRLLAALAYQESQWQPLATSPTGVRGIMMLTEDTADLLGVKNRLDATQSILAGAQYLSDLRDALPASVREPDRLWMAVAAYNLGMGHMNAARAIAKTLKANPDSWYEMKKVLPLLAKPQYYSHLKSGKGRGGEAVIMTENIRVYSDILNRYERPLHPLDSFAAPAAKRPPHKKAQRRKL